MRTLDLTPVFRSTVGFDRMARMMDAAMRANEASNQPSYPPYNIEQLGEDDYRISIATAGFSESELDITVEDGTLIVSGKQEKADEESSTFLYRGIATRAFERRYQLADHIKVKGAGLENGLLHIELVREVPEAKKPRKIEIGAGTKLIGEKKAA